jgi:RecQ-mediated genome instability protein 1
MPPQSLLSRTAMPVVAEVRDYLARRYPKPSVDPVCLEYTYKDASLTRYSAQEWAMAAVAWLQDQLSLDPNAEHAPQHLLDNVDLQLLQSDLSDSMLHHTGLPTRVQSIKNGVIATPATGGPILVQILEVMEIGASAFNLMNVRQARKDGTDLSGLAVGTEEEGGEGAKEATYPRGMLSLTLSDGSVQVKAIEYRKIEGLALGETPLGFKVCSLALGRFH